MATSHYFYEIQDCRRSEYGDLGNWGVCSTFKESILYVINCFGATSRFDENTPFQEMFELGDDGCWWWKGTFPTNLRIVRKKMSAPIGRNMEHIIHKEWPEHFPKKFKGRGG